MQKTSSTIEAALLYDTMETMRSDTILPRLNKALQPQGIRFHACSKTAGGPTKFTGDRMHIVLSEVNGPLPSEIFQPALSSHFTRIKPADYAARIDRHHRAILIAVGDGPAPEAGSNTRTEKSNVETAPLDRKILSCYQTVVAAMETSCPDLVHWSQSDLLLTPEEVLRSRDLPFPMHIVTHPAPFSSGTDASGTPLIGFRARQSHLFCEKTLVMEECGKPLDFSLTVVDFLMLQFMAGQIGLRHGDVYNFSDAERIIIRHVEGSGERPEGYISVRFEKRGSHPRADMPHRRAAQQMPPSHQTAQLRGFGPATAKSGEWPKVSRWLSTWPQSVARFRPGAA